jgi:DNA-binding GntR family transcriptional regulator
MTRYSYRTVADVLRSRIADGTYALHDTMPTLGEVATEFKVARMTARNAFRPLEREGLIEVRQGQVALVVATPGAVTPPVSLESIDDRLERIEEMLDTVLYRLGEAGVSRSSE